MRRFSLPSPLLTTSVRLTNNVCVYVSITNNVCVCVCVSLTNFHTFASTSIQATPLISWHE